MKIAAINGSPRAVECTSLKLIAQMEKLLNERVETHQAWTLIKPEASPDEVSALLNTDVLLIAFPLYVDSLPAPLIELLVRLEAAAQCSQNKPTVYAICNCGFFDSHQTKTALEIVDHFAKRTGLPWGYGLGIGGGPVLSMFGEDWSKGPSVKVYKALLNMAAVIKTRGSGQNVFVAPKLPRFLYTIAGNINFRSRANKNGVEDIRLQPYLK